MTEALPASHSILCKRSLSSYVERHYDIGDVVECKFLNQGLNDTYLIRTSGEKYVLRVYHFNWRTKSDIEYELDAIAYLSRAGASVSLPLMRRDESRSATVVAPEGERFVVLFTFAQGEPLNYDEDEAQLAYLYGKSVATVHTHTKSFSSEHIRFNLSLENLLNQSLNRIKPLLSHRPNDWHYLIELSNSLSDKIRDLNACSELERGFCHGDFHGWNAHIDETQRLTFFDFDCCGEGWRAYDIATFFWGARIRDKHKTRCPEFLRGYSEIRQLPDADLESIPYFVAVRHIWLVGVLAAKGGDLGLGWMDDKYMDRQMKLWREMASECFNLTIDEIYLQQPSG